MEIKLQCGDTITIPKGCKAIVKGKSVVFEKEEKEEKDEAQEFKDGDVLHCTLDDLMLIFKAKHNHVRGCFDSHYNNKDLSDELWNTRLFRHATEEEKQLLFDKMEEQGLRWDAEEKRVEKIRWRAKKDGYYYYINRGLTTANTTESGYNTDTIRYSVLNYFRTKEHAKEAARRVQETLKKYHDEIGE